MAWYPILFVASATGIFLAVTLYSQVRLSLLLPLLIGLGGLLGLATSSSYPTGLLLAWGLVAIFGGSTSCACGIITLIAMRYFIDSSETRTSSESHAHLLALVLSLSSLGFLLALAVPSSLLIVSRLRFASWEHLARSSRSLSSRGDASLSNLHTRQPLAITRDHRALPLANDHQPIPRQSGSILPSTYAHLCRKHTPWCVGPRWCRP